MRLTRAVGNAVAKEFFSEADFVFSGAKEVAFLRLAASPVDQTSRLRDLVPGQAETRAQRRP